MLVKLKIYRGLPLFICPSFISDGKDPDAAIFLCYLKTRGGLKTKGADSVTITVRANNWFILITNNERQPVSPNTLIHILIAFHRRYHRFGK